MQIIAIGTKIYANLVDDGMIIETEAGEQVAVEGHIEGYDTLTFTNGGGRTAEVAYGARVTLVGYFNPA